MYSYVRGGHVLYSYVRGGHVYVFVRTWRSRFAGHVISFVFFCSVLVSIGSSRVSLPVSSGVGGGGGGGGCGGVYILLFWCIL